MSAKHTGGSPGELHANLDNSNMLSLVESLGSHFAEARSIGESFAATLDGPRGARANHVVICGMGGSAIGADMICSWSGSGATVPLHVWRGYEMPAALSTGAFGLVSSYSGNTAETLAAEQSLRDADAFRVAVTSGGTLAGRMKSAELPCCLIPGGMPPRAAIAFSFIPTVCTLAAYGYVSLDPAELDETIEQAGNLCARYSLEREGGPAFELASAIHGRLPIIYSCDELLGAISRRWACQINENAKSLAHFALFPELCHNEIVGWEALEELMSSSAVIVLEDREDHPAARKQLDTTLELIAPHCPSIHRFETAGTGRMARMMSLMILGDFTSVYLAYLNGVDPTPVAKIDTLKKRIA